MWPKKPRRNNLDDIIGWWSKTDPITVRMLCQNLAVVGKSGSGKSKGSGDFLLRGVVAYRDSFGAIYGSKPDDLPYARRVFREERSESDLVVIEPGGEHHFNALEYELAAGADTRDLTQALMTWGENLARTEGGGEGSRDPFWAQQNRRQLHNAIEIVTRASGRIDPWLLQNFIVGAANSLQEVADPTWQLHPHYQLIKAAKQNAKTPIELHDVKLAEQYFLAELPSLNDRTRSSITAGVMGLLHALNTGIVRELLCTSTTITPDELERERKWLFVNMPIVPGDASAAMVNSALKYEMQRYILRRNPGPFDPIYCLFFDEFQKVANSYDAAFLAECRSHKGMMIALTQSLHAMYANMGGKGGEHLVDSLVTNYGQVVVHTLGDAQSANQFAALLGQRREIFVSTSISSDRPEAWDVLWGQAPASVSVNESYQNVLQPAVLLSGLRQGGPPDNIVDGVVIRTGQPFNDTGENYLITSFKQR